MTKTFQAVPHATAIPDGPAFRQAMAQVTSAVHVVTTRGPQGRAGLTATSVASVSDAPPTMLVCVDGISRTLATIEASGSFCINTLTGSDAELAEIFARRRGIEGEARFATAAWTTLATGAPVLAGALAAFDCRLIEVHRVATHRVLIGEVVAIGGTGQGSGLIYRQRGFSAT
ncbi:flavin reductase family protein [Bosea sp. (in: a-proteobacteria)]|jgi:flavin reductase (DIM6/NTAB) family NADH-FMN oxidoreductase RutF|uniref:flavin reductase family protein n=1 Tax=Bosea sp. (in: a-proteobacteria) TaxID=1871050 RepID=UPI003F6F57EC